MVPVYNLALVFHKGLNENNKRVDLDLLGCYLLVETLYLIFTELLKFLGLAVLLHLLV